MVIPAVVVVMVVVSANTRGRERGEKHMAATLANACVQHLFFTTASHHVGLLKQLLQQAHASAGS